MANTVIRGRHTNANYPSNTGLDVIDGRIIRLLGIKAPTMNLIGAPDGKLGMEETDDKFRWRTQDPQPNYLTVNGSHTSGDTTVLVDEADLAQIGQYLYDQGSGEMLRITNIDSSTNYITVERGVNGTSAAAISDNDNLHLMPQALTATEIPGYTPMSTGEFRENYFCQFGWKMGQDYWSSGKPSYMLEPNEKSRLQQAKQDFMLDNGQGIKARQMEIAAWYATGQAMGTNQRGYFKGISQFIDVYTSSSVGVLTINAIYDHIQSIMDDNALVPGTDNTRTFRLYGNHKMLAVFNALASSYSSTHKTQNENIAPNLRVAYLESDWGRLEFMVIRQLADGELYGVDFNDIQWKEANFSEGPNNGLWMEFEQDHTNLGYPAVEWQYRFRGSLKLGHPNNHFKMTGITVDSGSYANWVGPTS